MRILGIIAITAGSLMIILTAMLMGYNLGLYSQQQKIDLPEEIYALSTDKNKPDTLIGYQINGVITIGFKH